MNPSLHDTINQIDSSHQDLSNRYDCRAYMTTVTFLYCGIAHRARKFYRADLEGTGKIEIYTLEPYAGAYTTCTPLGWYSSATCEDWVGYVAPYPTSRLGRLAHHLIQTASGGDVLGDEMSERFAAVELR